MSQSNPILLNRCFQTDLIVKESVIRVDPLKKYKTVLTPDLLEKQLPAVRTLLFFFPR